jgi:hypothetical protein
MAPLRLSLLYVPVLPRSMSADLLDCPRPYFVGLLRHNLGQRQIPEDTLVVSVILGLRYSILTFNYANRLCYNCVLLGPTLAFTPRSYFSIALEFNLITMPFDSTRNYDIPFFSRFLFSILNLDFNSSILRLDSNPRFSALILIFSILLLILLSSILLFHSAPRLHSSIILLSSIQVSSLLPFDSPLLDSSILRLDSTLLDSTYPPRFYSSIVLSLILILISSLLDSTPLCYSPVSLLDSKVLLITTLLDSPPQLSQTSILVNLPHYLSPFLLLSP